jgi:phospholipase/carboxylesterase
MNNTWYPYSFLAPLAHNEPWLSSAVEMVQSCIEEMKRYLPVESIFLAGFSQGACLCLESAARNPAPYGGIVAFTGGLVGKEVQHEIYTGSFEGCKVFISNSDRDPHVPLERSLETATVLEKMDASVRHVTYPGMPHTVTQEALKAAKQWLS